MRRDMASGQSKTLQIEAKRKRRGYMPEVRTEFGMGNLSGDLRDSLRHLCRMALKRWR
jgi:hypothetical protein